MKEYNLKALGAEIAQHIADAGLQFNSTYEVRQYAKNYGWDAEIDEYGPEDIYERTDEQDEELTGHIANALVRLLPKEKKTRRRVAYYCACGETLTMKQLNFLRSLPRSDFWDEGINSTIWVDCLADVLDGEFADNSMLIGAMVSTLSEKKVVEVSSTRLNGKKVCSFKFTEKGKDICREIDVK